MSGIKSTGERKDFVSEIPGQVLHLVPNQYSFSTLKPSDVDRRNLESTRIHKRYGSTTEVKSECWSDPRIKPSFPAILRLTASVEGTDRMPGEVERRPGKVYQSNNASSSLLPPPANMLTAPNDATPQAPATS